MPEEDLIQAEFRMVEENLAWRTRMDVQALRQLKSERVDEVVARLPATAWKRVVVAEGSRWPQTYEYACLWVWFGEEGLPSGPERLLVRRSVSQQAALKYHRSNALAEVPLEKLALVRGGHWSVEQSFQAAKGGVVWTSTRREAGWVGTIIPRCRYWPCGSWCCNGGDWEKKEPQMTVPEVRALLVHLLEVRRWDEAEILHWSAWRQERNWIAKECDCRHRRAEMARCRRCCLGAL
jgi:hypothetical protein